MSQRFPYATLVPPSYSAMLALSRASANASVGKVLIDLVYLRVSQMNACAYCVDLHWRDLLAQGDDLQRLNTLVAWREVDFFDRREQAALAWAESLNELHRTHVSDADYTAVREHFDEREVAELTFAVAQMNAWNRIAIASRMQVERQLPPTVTVRTEA